MTTLGRRLLLGAPPGALGADALALVQRTGAMGLVLFRSNLTQPAQLPQQLTWLRERLGRPLVMAIDHEGGQVIRHLERSTIWPGNYALGRVAERDQAQAELWAEQVGLAMGRELRGLGIGWNLAPVLDVVGKEPNPGLGLRALGNDSERVTQLGLAMLRGFGQAGMVACGKHFPGLGRAQVDPHHELPRLDLSQAELATHGQPFRAAIQAGLPAVMTTHVLVPALDEHNVITLSRLAIQTYLRQELQFTGVCVSDDLDMGAMAAGGNIEDITLKTLQAGHDLAIIVRRGDWVAAVMDTLTQAADQGLLPEHGESLARIDKIVAQADIAQVLPSTQAWQPATLLAENIARAAVRVVGDPQGLLPVQWPVRLYLPDVTPVADWVLFESCWFAPSQMADLLGIPTAEIVTTSLQEATVLNFIGDNRITNILILYDAIRYPGQQYMLDRLAQTGQLLVVVLVRNPWDAQRVPAGVTVIDAAGFRSPQLAQVGRLLRGTG
ncbi:Beta-glucosidase-related glycosidase Glycosyl hydrolase family 3 N terminal domain protein [Gloeomargarita lithophora Alchichica-D10]|uniref:beta-N-acetylhexosaminidase n=1 Tax=Gloeomargarita lithophora Alchichica-D10 TaxID=1188229 RepID=A0A1J0ABX9_9CYAN|nr:glycoside hydrolase family 3 N-terminal domain-containing protein [Gloeomargarita lithophora]APB33434.1 Beta-glucosidase-related glycosidase Glycosyl hydrolase family 3 N terminal domain protein [Gloeomargarita lithophora Alchichica-D10]